MPMTIEEAANFLGKRDSVIRQYIKAGRIAVVEREGRSVMLVNAADVAMLAGRSLPQEYSGEQPSRVIAGTALLTDEVREAGLELLEALGRSARESGLSREEVEGKIARVICEMGEELESMVSRLPRGVDSQAAVPRRNAGSRKGVVERNPFLVAAAP